MSGLHKVVAGGEFSLLHAHGFKAGLVARLLAGITGIPCLVTVHSDFAQAQAGKFKPIYLQAERLLARQTYQYITVSEWLKKELIQTYRVQKEKICVIPNGIDLVEYGAAKSHSLFGHHKIIMWVQWPGWLRKKVQIFFCGQQPFWHRFFPKPVLLLPEKDRSANTWKI